MKLLLYARPVAMGAFRDSGPNFFLCPEKFVLNIYFNKNKNLALLHVYFALQTSKPGYRLALCQPTLSNL